MNPALREQLIRAEQRFLLAVASNDEELLKVFSQEWSQLARDLEITKAAGRLDDNTAHLLSEVSQAIENVTACMLESGSILQESLALISDFIQDIPCGDPSITSHPSQAIAPCCLLFSKFSSSILGQQKLLDSYAYCWLMQNLHNPYPNSVQSRIISDISGASVAQVELWFQEVRNSIGWSKLSRNYFAGSVNATVAAARRVYQERDKNISFDIVFAFTAMKTSAETLFSECQPLEGKDVDLGSIGAVQTMVMGQDRPMGCSLGEYTTDSDSILVPPQAEFSVPPNLLSDLSDSDESEEEDTTPPPSIAGCKRLLVEDEFTFQAADPERPQKRRRTWSINWAPSSEPDCPPLLPSTLSPSPKKATHMALVSPFSSLHPLSPTPQESSPDPRSFISQNRGYTDDTLEGAVGSIHVDVSVHGTRKRRLSQCVSPVPSKRQCRPSNPTKRHSGMNPMLSSDGCQDKPTDSEDFLQPTLQVPVDSNVPLNIGVFDSFKSTSDPFAGTAPSTLQPPVFYVPSSDLVSQLPEPPDLGHDANITFSSSSNLGSLEDLSSLLQFPIPAGPPPDLSTSFAASFHSGDSSTLLQDTNLSTIAEFIDLFPPGSTQSSSPLTSSSDPLTPPENLHLSLPPSQPCIASEQPLFKLDSSAPPSTVLPFGPGTFTEDVDYMFSLFCREL